MEKTLKVKKKNTLANLIVLLVSILLLVIGFVGYIWAKNFSFFYLIAVANILIIYVLIANQVKRDEVVYDEIFLKYNLNKKIGKIKIEEISAIEKQEKNLLIQLSEGRSETIDLEAYSTQSVEKVENLLKQLTSNEA